MNAPGKPPRAQLAVDFRGQTLCLKDAAKAAGLSYWTLYDRYRKGQRGDTLFRAPKSINPYPEQHENGDGV